MESNGHIDESVEEGCLSPFLDAHALFRFWSLLRQTYSLLLKSQERSLASHGFNVSQYMSLFFIHYLTPPVTPKTIASSLSQETASVTYALDRLEEKGLIVRGPAAGDRRETWLSITEEGRRLLSDANNAAWEPLRELSVVFENDAEVAQISATLARLRNRGALVYGVNVEALDFAAEHLAPDPFIFEFWKNSRLD